MKLNKFIYITLIASVTYYVFKPRTTTNALEAKVTVIDEEVEIIYMSEEK
tara:strand:- start:1948 stop:2097 length:150 start_codon:yes stop_codon:yes gene_type:complete